MTTISHQPQPGGLEVAAPETVATLDGLRALSDISTPAQSQARASGRAWNCLEHVPGASIFSWVSECLSFGGLRRRQEAAQAAYDARWAGYGVGERRDERWSAPGVVTESVPPLRQPRRITTTRGSRVA